MLPWWAVSTADHMTHHRVQASEEELCDFSLTPRIPPICCRRKNLRTRP